MKVNDKRKKKQLELNAIAWKGGVSYGKFALTLTQKEKNEILKEYLEMLAEREREQRERIAKYRAQKREQSKKTPLRWQKKPAARKKCS